MFGLDNLMTELERKTVCSKCIIDFCQYFLVYVSHLSPYQKEVDKVKLSEILLELKIDFNPKKYLDTANIPDIKNFYINLIFPSKLELDDFVEILYLFDVYSKTIIFNNKPIDDIYNNCIKNIYFNNDLMLKAHVLVKSVSIGIVNDYIINMVLSSLNPQIVSNFVCNPFLREIISLREQVKKYSSLVDRKNTEKTSMKTNFDKEKTEYLRLDKQNDELKKMCEEMLKKCKELTKENDEFKKRVKEKEVRKQRLSELRARVAALIKNPDHQINDEYEQLKKEHQELSEDVPCCAISQEPLHMLKKQGKALSVLKCGHIFEDGMLKSWLSIGGRNKCPSCKAEVKRGEMHSVYL